MNNEYQNWRDDTAKGIEWAVQKHRLSDKIAFLYRKERVFRQSETKALNPSFFINRWTHANLW